MSDVDDPTWHTFQEELLKPAVEKVAEELGPGLTEAIYRNALSIELNNEGFRNTQEVVCPVTYQSHVVGAIRSDILIKWDDPPCESVIELKVASKITEAHREQCRAYLRRMPKESFGFVINFGSHGKVELEHIFRPKKKRKRDDYTDAHVTAGDTI